MLSGVVLLIRNPPEMIVCDDVNDDADESNELK